MSILKKLLLFSLIMMLLLTAGCTSDSIDTDNDSVTAAGIQQEKTVEEEPLECDWIMEVDDKIESMFEGVKFEYTLTILAEKKGGIDELGTYKGKVYLKTEMDVPSTSDGDTAAAGHNIVESAADQAIIEVKPYDPAEYANFGFKEGELMPLAPIIDNAVMALANIEMTHKWNYVVDLTFEDGEQANINKDTDLKSQVPAKFIIEGGQLMVDIPRLKTSRAFKGTVTGNPISE